MEPNTVMLFVWIGLMVAFTVIEAVTVQLVTIWFAVGSLVALIANIAGANIVVQWLIFVAVSAVCLRWPHAQSSKRLSTQRRSQPMRIAALGRRLS